MKMEYYLSLLLFLIFLLTIVYLLITKHKPSSSQNPLTSYPIIGTIPHVIKNSHRVVDWSAELLDATTTGTVAVFPFVFTIDPRNIRHISLSNFNNYRKCSFILAAFRDFLGDGIVNVGGGEEWRQQRRSVSHVFCPGSLRGLVLGNLHCLIQERLIPLLSSAAVSGDSGVLDLQDVLERLAFDNICRVVLDYDPNCLQQRQLQKDEDEGERLFRAFHDASYLSVERAQLPFSAIWKLKKLLNIGSEKRLRESMATIHKLVGRSIQSSKNTKSMIDSKLNKDLLSQLVQDGSRQQQSDQDLRDNLINFVMAGRDTTPSALTWFFWLLSSRPKVVGKILEEIRRIREQIDDEFYTIFDSVRDMEYLHAAITESMRLYPPAPMLARECRSHDRLPDGTEVRNGWIVMYHAMAMGRDKKIWGEDCMEFKPERWFVDGVFREKNAFEYPVFHGGPRVCLGKDIAFVQMKAVAASILEGFEMEVVEERGKYQVSVALRMEGGLPVRVKERKQKAR